MKYRLMENTSFDGKKVKREVDVASIEGHVTFARLRKMGMQVFKSRLIRGNQTDSLLELKIDTDETNTYCVTEIPLVIKKGERLRIFPGSQYNEEYLSENASYLLDKNSCSVLAFQIIDEDGNELYRYESGGYEDYELEAV